MQAWIEEELRTSDFGDARLAQRFVEVVSRLSQKPSASIPTACETWKETQAAYRFFDNKRVDEHEILQPHRVATIDRIADQDVVLLVQDTTEIEITRPEEQMEGAGPLNDEFHIGFHNHAMLAVTPDRVPLGVLGSKIWARDWEEYWENQRNKASREKRKKQKAIEEKESVRWLEGYRQGCEIAAQVQEATLVVVSDSEGDIFECFAEAEEDRGEKRAEWIVRACQNRSLTTKDENGHWKKLWDEAGSEKVLGTWEVEVSKNRPNSGNKRRRNQPRDARTAVLTIHATRVSLKGPHRPGGKLTDVEINVVLAREMDPPPDEEPVEWLLLTSLPINTWKAVCLVIEYYCCRWLIEIYFRVLKSGCRVEELQLKTAERFKPCLALYMIVAWRVMYVTMLGRECPETSCDLVFGEDEWQSVYTVVRQEAVPKVAPSLEEMIYMIARLGGHLGRSYDGPPGPKTMWIGMQRMADLARAWRTFGPTAGGPGRRKTCV